MVVHGFSGWWYAGSAALRNVGSWFPHQELDLWTTREVPGMTVNWPVLHVSPRLLSKKLITQVFFFFNSKRHFPEGKLFFKTYVKISQKNLPFPSPGFCGLNRRSKWPNRRRCMCKLQVSASVFPRAVLA